jgi:hypothetical protein
VRYAYHQTPARQECVMRPVLIWLKLQRFLRARRTCWSISWRVPRPASNGSEAPAHRLDRVIINPVGHGTSVRTHVPRFSSRQSTRGRPARPVRGVLELAFSSGSYLLEETRCRVARLRVSQPEPGKSKQFVYWCLILWDLLFCHLIEMRWYSSVPPKYRPK